MAAPMDRVREIRAELNRLAPLPKADDDGLTAVKLARYLAMEAQVVWARLTSLAWPITPAEICTLNGNFAASHALLSLAWVDEKIADETAAQIAGAWEDGGGIGEWLCEHHGEDPARTQRIADLAAELARVTPKTCGSCHWGLVDVTGCTCDRPGPNGEHDSHCGTAPCPNGCFDKCYPGGES